MPEHLPPYDIVHILNRFFDLSRAVVASQHGRIDNYMGDGFLALFGLDRDLDRELDAVNAGLEIIETASTRRPSAGPRRP